MRYLLAVLLLVPALARAEDPWIDGPKVEPKAEPKKAALPNYNEAHALALATGKPLVAWVGVQALCPD